MSQYTMIICFLKNGYINLIINKYKVMKKIILKGQRASVLKSDRTSHNALYMLQFRLVVTYTSNN